MPPSKSPIAWRDFPRPARSIASSAMRRRSLNSRDALRSGRLHHAWLLVGPEGVGKATLAYHLAREVLALGEEAPGERGADVPGRRQ